MKMRRIYILAAVLCILGIARANAASLLYTFDTSAAGADGGAFNAGNYAWSSAYQAVQATDTAGGWTMGSGGGPQFEFGWPSQSTVQTIATAGDGRVSFDLFVDANSFVGTWADGDWYQLHFAGNSNGGGWTQDAGGSNPVDTNYHPGTGGNWHFDESFAQMGWTTSATWFQLEFGANSASGHSVQFYIDNIQVYEVPEPATCALIGLGTAGLLIFRRRS
jgi:PEP-CTERM motif